LALDGIQSDLDGAACGFGDVFTGGTGRGVFCLGDTWIETMEKLSMIRRDIDDGIAAAGSGDAAAMIEAFEALKENS
jgi:hypothetical protein